MRSVDVGVPTFRCGFLIQDGRTCIGVSEFGSSHAVHARVIDPEGFRDFVAQVRAFWRIVKDVGPHKGLPAWDPRPRPPPTVARIDRGPPRAPFSPPPPRWGSRDGRNPQQERPADPYNVPQAED